VVFFASSLPAHFSHLVADCCSRLSSPVLAYPLSRLTQFFSLSGLLARRVLVSVDSRPNFLCFSHSVPFVSME